SIPFPTWTRGAYTLCLHMPIGVLSLASGQPPFVMETSTSQSKKTKSQEAVTKPSGAGGKSTSRPTAQPPRCKEPFSASRKTKHGALATPCAHQTLPTREILGCQG